MARLASTVIHGDLEVTGKVLGGITFEGGNIVIQKTPISATDYTFTITNNGSVSYRPSLRIAHTGTTPQSIIMAVGSSESIIASSTSIKFATNSDLNTTTPSNIRMNINTDGTVTIGTTSVDGSALLTIGTAVDKVAFDFSGSNAIIRLIDNNQTNPPTIKGNGSGFHLENGGSTRIFIKSDGNVGIGTTNPTSILEIVQGDGIFKFSSTATLQYTASFSMDNTGIKIGHNSSARDLQLQTNNATRLTINSSGNIGIGTTSPEEILHLVSDTDVNLILSNAHASATSSIYFRRSLGTHASRTAVGIDNTLGNIIAYGFDGTNYINAAEIKFEVDLAAGTNDMPGRIKFNTTPDGSSVSQERMRLTSAGNLGIGVTNPSDKLEVNGNIKATNVILTGYVSGTTLTSTIAIGTAPLTITSTTVCTNLNADLLDGNHASAFATLTGTETLTNKTLTNPKINNTYNSDGNIVLMLPVVSSSVNYFNLSTAATGGAPFILVSGSDTNISLNLRSKGTGVIQANGVEVVTISGTQTLTNKTLTAPRFANSGFIADSNGNELLRFTVTASAVNDFNITNAATTGIPVLSVVGTDTNISMNLVSKGTGIIQANGQEIYHVKNIYKSGKLNIYKSSKDGNGIFTVITYKRTDATNYMVATLSGGTSPKYTTRTEVYYDTNGTTVLETLTYTISYDVDDDIESEVLA
jgi:hypothetical protein